MTENLICTDCELDPQCKKCETCMNHCRCESKIIYDNLT